MPTVRGLIQDIQHNGLLHHHDLSLLSNCTIGIDAVSFFEPLYVPSTSHDVLGSVDRAGLEQVVLKQLRFFQKHTITPIFVFPGISPNDRTNILHHQQQLQQEEELAAKAALATPQPAVEESAQSASTAQSGKKKNKNQQIIAAAAFGDEAQVPAEGSNSFTSMYRPINNKKKGRANKFAFDDEPTQQQATPAQKPTQHQPPAPSRSTSATSTSSSPLDDVQWSFDELSLHNRQRGWDLLMSEKNKNITASQLFFQEMSTSFNFQYRKALLHILQQYSTPKDDITIKVVVLHAPYSVSAQLAWLQRSPHRFVHAVLGHSDILLFGVDKYIQTVNFEASSFNYVVLREVLTHYGLSLTQLISVSLLSGYSFALTHPLALNDPKFTSSFSFSHALKNFQTHGKGSLQTLLEWWVQQPPGPIVQQHHTNASNPGKKDHNVATTLTLDEQINMVTNINKVMQHLQGSAVISPGGELALLRETTCQMIDIPRLTAVGRVAHKLFKQQILQEKQAAIQGGGPILKGKQLQQNLTPVQVNESDVAAELQHLTPQPQIDVSAMIRPNVPLSHPLLQLLTTSTIQPSSLSSLFTGHILDVTVHNPSTELDKLLDWANLALRGPAIWSILYSFNANSDKPTVHPAYKSLYNQIKPQQKIPFVLNSRFNDRRKNLYPRDIISYCRQGGCDNDNTYGVDQINKFENVDNLFKQEQLQGFIALLDKMTWDPHDATQINPIAHYLTLLPALWKIQPHPDPSSAATNKKQQKKKAAIEEEAVPQTPLQSTLSPTAMPLTVNEKVIGLTMLYILYFIGLITPQATFTRMGYAINQFLVNLQQSGPEALTYLNKNHQLYDTILFLYILVNSDILNTKFFSMESSELTNPTVTVSGKGENSQHHIYQRILFRIMSLLPIDVQTNMSESNTALITELLSKKSQTVPETAPEAAAAAAVATPPTETKLNQKGNTTKRAIHDRQISMPLLTVLHRELVCYSALANSLISTFQYAFDLILSAITLYNVFDSNAIVCSQLAIPVPLQSYQASPLLACLLRQNVLSKPKKGQQAVASAIPGVENMTLPAPLKSIFVGFWDALSKGTGGFGIATEDAQTALDLVASQ